MDGGGLLDFFFAPVSIDLAALDPNRGDSQVQHVCLLFFYFLARMEMPRARRE